MARSVRGLRGAMLGRRVSRGGGTWAGAVSESAAVFLSAVIITLDEEARIADAVASVRPWVGEVLVLDGGSTDATLTRARAAGARVEQHPFDSFVSQKQRAVELARGELVFALDADERVGPTLGRALAEAARGWTSASKPARVRRLNYLDGVPLRHGRWGRDRPLRLFDRRRASYGGEDPHDHVVAEDPTRLTRLLDGNLHHDLDRDTRAYVRGTVRHARRAAASIAHRGRPGPAAPLLHGGAHLIRTLALGAPLDGRRGWTVAWVGALGTARKYRIARRLAS